MNEKESKGISDKSSKWERGYLSDGYQPQPEPGKTAAQYKNPKPPPKNPYKKNRHQNP